MSAGPKAGPVPLTIASGELALESRLGTRCTAGLLCSRLSRPLIDSISGARSAGTAGSAGLEYKTPAGGAANFTAENVFAPAPMPVKETSRVEASADLTVKPLFLSHRVTRARLASVGPKRPVNSSAVSHRW